MARTLQGLLTVESSMTRWSMPGKSINFNGGAVNKPIAMRNHGQEKK
jgi:hypothetical protein